MERRRSLASGIASGIARAGWHHPAAVDNRQHGGRHILPARRTTSYVCVAHQEPRRIGPSPRGTVTGQYTLLPVHPVAA